MPLKKCPSNNYRMKRGIKYAKANINIFPINAIYAATAKLSYRKLKL